MADQTPSEADDLDPTNKEAEALLNAYQRAINNDDTEQAEHNAFLFMAHAVEEMQRNPNPELLLRQEATLSETDGEWLRAEEIYHQLLAIAIAEGNAMGEWKANDNLHGFYSFLGKTELASNAASAATEAARRADMQPLLVRALENQARNDLKMGSLMQALALAEEILRMIPHSKMNATQRARALVLRASCFTELGELVSAQADLDAALSLFSPMLDIQMFAGVQSGMASLWQATARLLSIRGNHTDAAKAWGTSVEYRRVVSQQPQLDGLYKFAWLAQALRHYGEALIAADDHKAADEAFAESRAIMRSIHHPDAAS
ncbi:hypothetical protein CCAX7_60000 [Capsulimonas corticalis]|uniref:Uncharacterized protein n=1 Tax=Capsulimonas corticalis TaxID=2219043 RepID=A0A402CZN1_9BACT|nr:hypothetical protein [Capsulimonas corticalis]BDI33949.1 hypothetical protein CCAX7_60000 [Capsulimonas corticalis]